MLRMLTACVVVTVCASAAHAQTTTGLFGCSTDNDHERCALKTRPKPPSLSPARTITLSRMLAWTIPAGHTAAEENAIPPREPRLHTLTAYVRKIGLSEDDCDFNGRRGNTTLATTNPVE